MKCSSALFCSLAATLLVAAAPPALARPQTPIVEVPVAGTEYQAVRTWKEQASALAATTGVTRSLVYPAGFAQPPRRWDAAVLDRIEMAIRQANFRDPDTLRRPVPSSALQRLRTEVNSLSGRWHSSTQIQAMTDYGHALLREAPWKSLQTKLTERSPAGRPGLHGTVAELAEARSRDMVLTRDKQSRTFDLTEDRIRPRSTQLKIYMDDAAAFRAMVRDLQNAPKAARHGIMTAQTLQRAEARGWVRSRMIQGTTFYFMTDGSRVTLLSSNVFASAAESRAYASTGQALLTDLMNREARAPSQPHLATAGMAIGQGAVLVFQFGPSAVEDALQLTDSDTRTVQGALRFAEHGSELFAGGVLLADGGWQAGRLAGRLAPGGWLASVSRWAGPLTWGALGVTEAVQVTEWYLGYTTDRQFAHGQAQLLGGLAGGAAGGWAGMKAGAMTGGSIGMLFGPGGAATGATIGGVVGAFGGGLAGGYLAAGAAGGGVERLAEFHDRETERRYVEFIRRHYGLE